ncbi:MAG TPA: CPXCG motif-containing cysteine-rich protein [Gemmatimonadales bacterium]|nr:CPXCG motif-containing cysteine-rich protein [Gemmatimonadales bacterium]
MLRNIARASGRIHRKDGDLMGEHDEFLDQEFPLGDGTAETEATVPCPYCGEINVIGLDPGGGPRQEYVEDCQVCCRPWKVLVNYLPDGSAVVSLEAESLD